MHLASYDLNDLKECLLGQAYIWAIENGLTRQPGSFGIGSMVPPVPTEKKHFNIFSLSFNGQVTKMT